jgi:N utilization substance protein B
VTINEYIDIAKSYSTPQSGQFVNGILDGIHKDLLQEGKLKKVDFKKQG